jgi:hypothetical protein
MKMKNKFNETILPKDFIIIMQMTNKNRKIILYIAVSSDGYIATLDGSVE